MKSFPHFFIKFSIIISISISVFLFSCDNKTVYKEFIKFPDLELAKNDIKTFIFENTDDVSKVDVYLAFRYAQGFQFDIMLFSVIEKSPVGNFPYPISIQIKDDNGKYIGEGSGDIWDIEIPIKQNVSLAKGTYRYEISSNMPLQKLNMIMEVGLIIKKSNQ